MKPLTEAQIEREQVEWVFGLTGGELADEPWYPYAVPEDYDRPYCPRRHTVYYWYEGAPEYATEYTRDYAHTYRTTVTFRGGYLSAPAKELVDADGVWELVVTFASSGETECPMGDKEEITPDEAQNGRCPFCEEKVWKSHGYIHIGEGYEAVYRLVPQTREDDAGASR